MQITPNEHYVQGMGFMLLPVGPQRHRKHRHGLFSITTRLLGPVNKRRRFFLCVSGLMRRPVTLIAPSSPAALVSLIRFPSRQPLNIFSLTDHNLSHLALIHSPQQEVVEFVRHPSILAPVYQTLRLLSFDRVHKITAPILFYSLPATRVHRNDLSRHAEKTKIYSPASRSFLPKPIRLYSEECYPSWWSTRSDAPANKHLSIAAVFFYLKKPVSS